MNILITGCNGQLGNEIQLLEPQMPQHCFFNTDIANSTEGVSNYHRLDITDSEAIEQFIEENAIDGIINCAAFTAVDKAEDSQDLCTLLNANAPGYLAQAVGRRNGFFVQVSTDYVFDGTANRPYRESAPTCPNSVYGMTKLAGEEAALRGCRNTMIIRTAWLYSEFGNNFVKTMLRLGREKSELGVIFDQIGTPTYAYDLACSIMTAIIKGIKPGVYHYSNEGVISWYDFTKAIHRLAGISTCHVRPLHTEEYPTPASRPHYSVLDKTKFKDAYGIDIPYWEDSLAKCIEKLTTR